MHDDDCDHEAVRQLAFHHGGAPVEKLRELESVIAQFESGTKPADRRLVARALYEKAKILALTGKNAEALATCATIRERFGRDDDDDEVLRWLGESLLGAAVSYSALWLSDEARAAYREAVERFAGSASPQLRAFAPRALSDECVRARNAHDLTASLAAADEARRFASDPAPEVRYWAERAMQGGGLTEEKAGRTDDAIRTYESVYALFVNDADARVRDAAISSGFDVGRVLQACARHREAIARFEALVHGHQHDETAATWIAQSWLDIGVLHGELGDPKGELAMYERIESTFGASSKTEILQWVAAAARNKAIVQRDALGDRDAARATFTALIERYAPFRDAAIARQVQSARADLARMDAGR